MQFYAPEPLLHPPLIFLPRWEVGIQPEEGNQSLGESAVGGPHQIVRMLEAESLARIVHGEHHHPLDAE
jgi:hypothetical protein